MPRAQAPESAATPQAVPPARGHILVVGNAKGGSGKSTTAMHVVARLLHLGHRVAVIDLDGQQQTLGRYLEHRALFAARQNIQLRMPGHEAIVTGPGAAGERHAYEALCTALERACAAHDVVVLDCPGHDSALARLGHLMADTLVTPVNDSFVDLDLLAHIDPQTHRVLRPSWYSDLVWALRTRRFVEDGHRLDWVVVRNRLGHADAHNKRHVATALGHMARPFGFRQLRGMAERTIFRELFLRGLTLSDLKGCRTGVPMTMSHIAAHQEIKALVAGLRLPAPAQQADAAGSQASAPARAAARRRASAARA